MVKAVVSSVAPDGVASGPGLIPEVQSDDFTAAPGRKYFVDTSGGAVDITLPAGTPLSQMMFIDAEGTWATNKITITPNGLETIAGSSSYTSALNYEQITLAYDAANTDWLRGRTDHFPASVLASMTWTPAVVADDTAISLDFGADVLSGQITISHNNSGLDNYGIFGIRAASSSAYIKTIAATGITATTGVLAGTTGSDATVTISTHTDQSLYIENRTGSTLLFTVGLNLRFLPLSLT